MTPRQLATLITVADERARRERAEQLSLHVLASRGKPEQVRSHMRELTK